MELQDVLEPVAVSVFFSEYFGRRFLHVSGTPGRFQSIMPWEALNLLRLSKPIQGRPPGDETIALSLQAHNGDRQQQLESRIRLGRAPNYSARPEQPWMTASRWMRRYAAG